MPRDDEFVICRSEVVFPDSVLDADLKLLVEWAECGGGRPLLRILAPEGSRECFWLLSAGRVNGGVNVALDAGAEREDFGVDDGVGCDEFSEG